MQEALIQDAQYDIDREEGHYNQHNLIELGFLKSSRCTWKGATNGAGYRKLLLHLLDCNRGLLKRHRRWQIEGDKDSGEKTVMID